jgi:hypothetical protein
VQGKNMFNGYLDMNIFRKDIKNQVYPALLRDLGLVSEKKFIYSTKSLKNQ